MPEIRRNQYEEARGFATRIVNYEALTRHTEQELQQIINFLDMAWTIICSNITLCIQAHQLVSLSMTGRSILPASDAGPIC